MTRPRIFLSAVSAELRTARKAAARTLRTLGYDPVSEDDFPTGHGELLEWLHEQIDGCEGLIQLVGDAYGAEPPEADPAYGRVSYTQFELLHAVRQGKKTWVIVIGEQYRRDKPHEQLDLPDGTGNLDPAAAQAYQAERRTLQQAYLARLTRENHLRHTANNDSELENLILRLRDELGQLRRGEEVRQRRLRNAVIAILLGLIVLGGGGWLGYRSLTTEVQQGSVVNTEKIRAHLRTTIEETHRRELEAAEAATDWQERQRNREAADAAHAARLQRIGELAASFAEIEGRESATSVFQEMTRILTEQGVDEAIAYVAAQRPAILQSVRSRAAAARERNRNELEPLLTIAALHEAKGQSAEVRALYAEILEVEPDWPLALHENARFLIAQGDGAKIYGRLVEARHEYDEARKKIDQLLKGEPANTEWQRDLSVSHIKIGDVLVAQGNLAGAREAYDESRRIFEALTKRDVANAQWQRDLSVSYERIGEVSTAQGYGTEALDAYKKSLEIRDSLVRRDGSSIEWQNDLSVSYSKIGDMLKAQRDHSGALKAYDESRKIFEALTKRDEANAQWKRNLSVIHQKIGDVLMEQREWKKAFDAYSENLTIFDELVRSDGSNTPLVRDWSVSYEKIGDVMVALHDWPRAKAAYDVSLAIRDALTKSDAANTDWKRDLSMSHIKIGDVLKEQGNLAGARDAYAKSKEILEVLVEHDKTNADWQRDLIIVYVRLSEASGDRVYVLKALEAAESMQHRGILAPGDARMIDDLKRRAQ